MNKTELERANAELRRLHDQQRAELQAMQARLHDAERELSEQKHANALLQQELKSRMLQLIRVTAQREDLVQALLITILPEQPPTTHAPST